MSAWLISRSSRKVQVPNPQEYEDPNVTISQIVDAVFRASGRKVSFPPSKLKQGFGPEVIWLLNVLTDLVLDGHQEKNGLGSAIISVKGLNSPLDQMADGDEDEITSNQDNDCEINSDEQNYQLIDDEPHQHENDPLSLTSPLGLQSAETDPGLDIRPKKALISSTDASQWMSEVDHVLPQLKLVLRSSDRKSDWRTHLTQLETHEAQMREQFSTTQSSLKKLAEEIKQSLERISSREKYVQNQFEPLISEYNSLKNQLQTMTENYRLASSGVTEKSQLLSEISDELDAVKGEMEERGSSMTDGSPVISLRKALQRIKAELTTIDIRIGVATHTILQSHFSEAAAAGTDEALHLWRTEDQNAKNSESLQRLVF